MNGTANGTATSTPFSTGTSAQPNPAPEARLYPLRALLGEWEDYAQAAHDAYTKGTPRGAVSGHPTLDRALGGCLNPGLHVVHGGSGVGKTAFCLQVAGVCGVPCVYVTAEMRPLVLLRRIVARVTETFLGRLESGELDPATSLAKARAGIAACAHLGILDACDAWASPEQIAGAVAAVRGDARRCLVVIDSVHSWAEALPSEATEYDRLSAAVAALRTLAGKLDLPILAIAERNRASMTGGGLNASAGTRKFEYGAESVLDLNEDKEEPALALNEKPVTLHVAKNRSGAAGQKVKLTFNGALQRFTDVDATERRQTGADGAARGGLR